MSSFKPEMLSEVLPKSRFYYVAPKASLRLSQMGVEPALTETLRNRKAIPGRILASRHDLPPATRFHVKFAINTLNSRHDQTQGETQRTDPTFGDGRYDANHWNAANAELSDAAIDFGARVFGPIASGQRPPGRPVDVAAGNVRSRVLVSGPRMLGFLGAGAHDISRLLHLLLVPKSSVEAQIPGEKLAEIAAGDAFPEGIAPVRAESPPTCTTSVASPRLRWVFDLEPSDLPLLDDMRRAGLAMVRANRTWFLERYARLDVDVDLLGVSVEEWLQEDRIQFGFHLRPSVGYMHMHMLVGPLTDFGGSYAENWIPLGVVERELGRGRSMRDVLQASKPGAL